MAKLNHSLILGLDLGTTSVKGCLFNTEGKVIYETEELTTTIYPKQGLAEQDAREIEQNTIRVVRNVTNFLKENKAEMIAISFSSAMHSIICVSQDGEALSPVMIWSDGRGNERILQLSSEQKEQYYKRTGTPVHPMTPLAKLLWMQKEKYEPYEQAAFFMSVKEYLIYKWFGKAVIDYGMASATGLYNPLIRQWDTELLELLQINSKQLSEIVPPTTILSNMKQDVAQEMGILTTIPVVIGSADGQLASLGSGALLPGEVAISVGTSGAVRQYTNSFHTSATQEVFCYAFTEDMYIVGGPTNNGGVVLQWLKQLIQYEGSIGELIQEAASIDIGADGILFLPYINGERAPLWNQSAVGNFYGLTIAHNNKHMIRAVLEGITYNLYQIGHALESSVGPAQKIYVNGGLARSEFWLQMLADIFNAEIIVAETHHSAAWGAAWTALVALGHASDYASIKSNIPLGNSVLPNTENVQQYKQTYAKYKELQQTLSKLF